jgi:hypothetical protein
MTKPTSDPRELIRLAVRMGIPPAEAVRRVMDHLTHRPTSDASPADARPAPETRPRARVRLIHGGRGVVERVGDGAGERPVSARRAEDPSPTTGSSASA